jgi:hypothetical protein
MPLMLRVQPAVASPFAYAQCERAAVSGADVTVGG